MNDSQFHQLADQLMNSIEDVFDHYDGDNDIDCEIHGNVLTLSFDNGNKLVINRQEPLHQIWLASKNAGYHFNYQEGHWYCDRSGQEFAEILSDACLKQTGEVILLRFE